MTGRERFSLAAALVLIPLCGWVPVHGEVEGPAEAGAGLEAEEPGAGGRPWGSVGHNLILKKEVVLGARYARREEEVSGVNGPNANSIGFDLLKRLTSKRGDWASVHLQMRLVYRWGRSPPLPQTEREDDWEVEWHEATLRLTGWHKGRLNFKVGHFDVPFGLEPELDTHGSLFQLQSARNVGFKKDWGLALYGQLPHVDYEASLTAGSGMELGLSEGAYLASARVGTPGTGRLAVGLSGLYGELQRSADRGDERIGAWRSGEASLAGGFEGEEYLNRWRLGVDIRYLAGPWTLMGEIAGGRDEGRDVRNIFVEADSILVPDRLDLISQAHFTRLDGAVGGGDATLRRTLGVLGLRARLTPVLTLAAAYERDLRSSRAAKRDTLAVQLYAYW